MIDVCAKIGDMVTITIEQESRDWGNNYVEDGTKAEILSFIEIYYNRLNT